MLQRYSEHQLILMYFDSHDDVVLSLPPVLILLTLAAAAFQSRAVNLKFMSLLALAFRRELRNVKRALSSANVYPNPRRDIRVY